MKNWFGQKPHPTDEYIHWTNKKPEDEAARLRPAWDKLAFYDEVALVSLMRAAYHMGELDEHDANNEDI